MITLNWIDTAPGIIKLNTHGYKLLAVKLDCFGRTVCEITEQTWIDPFDDQNRSSIVVDIIDPNSNLIQFDSYCDTISEAKEWADLFLQKEGYEFVDMLYDDFIKKFGAMM